MFVSDKCGAVFSNSNPVQGGRKAGLECWDEGWGAGKEREVGSFCPESGFCMLIIIKARCQACQFTLVHWVLKVMFFFTCTQ